MLPGVSDGFIVGKSPTVLSMDQVSHCPVYGLWFASWNWTAFSNCCFGGRHEKWTTIVNNSTALHDLLHRPDCPGHDWLEPYRVHKDQWVNYTFDTGEEADHPWDLCLIFSEAVADERPLNPKR